MEDEKFKSLSALVAQLQGELEELKGGDRASFSTLEKKESLEMKYRELQQKVDKIEGNLGVDKIVLTDIGDKVLVTVQTPLGSVPVSLPHTSNTTNKHSIRAGTFDLPSTHVSTTGIAPIYSGAAKGGPPAGMTTEQLQDFKKQTLQINALQQKIKELEGRLAESNSLIKHGEDITTDLTLKTVEDVKEIYLYLDNINTTMSEKIASQRVEMEKLSGNTPQPINYDPFNYGEAYAGDVVDFEARKRIVEMSLLFQSLQQAMSQLKDAVRISPSIDLGYKVVRLDQLLEATGFGPAVRSGEVTNEHGLLINQTSKIEPPERRYPRKEAFTTDEDKEMSWSVADSIMQTMYRLEVELSQLQSNAGVQEEQSHFKELEEIVMSTSHGKNHKDVEERGLRSMIEKECKFWMRKMTSSIVSASGENILDHHRSFDSARSSLFENEAQEGLLDKMLTGLKTQIKMLEQKVNAKCNRCTRARMSTDVGPRPIANNHTKISSNSLATAYSASFYKQPVKLRYLLQRVFRYQGPDSDLEFFSMPRPVGKGYDTKWPQQKMSNSKNKEESPTVSKDIKIADDITSIVQPTVQEIMIKGKDGRWYRGDKAAPKILVKQR